MRNAATCGLVLGCLVVGLVSCGDDAISISTSAENVCGEIAEVGCHNMYQCCSEGEIEQILRVNDPRTEAQCREDLRRQCERQIAPFDDGIAEGKIRFEPMRMNACLDALVAPSGTCATIVDEVPWAEVCMDTAWVGQVPIGEACRFVYECDGAADGQATCGANRQCKQRPQANQSCAIDQCAKDLFCDAQICKPLLGVGGSCTGSFQCLEDLFCDPDTAQCAAQVAAGAHCTTDQACASSDCLPGQCEGTFQQCFEGSDCQGHCSNGNFACFQPSDCGNGICSMTGGSCFSSCPGGAADVCVFPNQCLPGNCIGDPVCVEAFIEIDYCTDALNNLPI